jgi:lysophospholipase L1-like esterase
MVGLTPQSDVPTGNTVRNPLLDQVKRDFLGRAANPAPRASAVADFPATAGSSGVVSVSGVKKAAVWFVLRSNNSAGPIDTLFDKSIAGPSHGVPTSYVIDASNGSTWTTLVSVTGNNLSHRMHVVDLTGYTQVRMTANTVDAAYSGAIDLAVHDLGRGSDDTMVILGDSNCAMQQQGSGGIGIEAGRLGYEIHQRLPDRWPIVVPGGTSQATMASFLETPTYGMPRIRYWLQQLPVKYVALQIGSNDVNAWSQPATAAQLDAAQASMEKLIKEALAQGRTVVLPRLRWMDGNASGFPGGVHAYETQNLESWHARLDALAAKYPSVVVGPDVYTPSKDRSDLLNRDGVHPTAAGVAQSMQVWTDWAVATLYTIR